MGLIFAPIGHACECVRVCCAVIQPKLSLNGFPGWRKGPCPAGGRLGRALEGWPSHQRSIAGASWVGGIVTKACRCAHTTLLC